VFRRLGSRPRSFKQAFVSLALGSPGANVAAHKALRIREDFMAGFGRAAPTTFYRSEISHG